MMRQLALGTKVYLACRPTDMRRGMNGLAAQVTNVLHADPYGVTSRNGKNRTLRAADGSFWKTT